MIIGIDFGTSKSVAAVWDKGTSNIIPDLQGRTVMPSLVSVAPDEQLHIGWEALNHPQRYQSEYFTISSIKRMIGKAGETNWGQIRTYPQEVSALILGRLKMYAEAYCDSEVTQAVIAVPAHYNINQRSATKQASEIAGLKALRLVNEATAAVIAYSTLRNKREGFSAVFDFGGGTLDVSIVEYGEGVCDVKATAGDDQLGGDDFDQIIVDYLLEHIKKELGPLVELTPIQKFVLKEFASKAKIDLSSAPDTRIYLPAFIHTKNRNWDIDVSLDRNTFENLCCSLFDRADKVLQNALKDSYAEQLINEMILIGGTSRIPQIKKRVSNIMRLTPITLTPEYVAYGASILAGVLAGHLKEILLLDVIPRSYGVETLGGIFTKMINKNCSMPTKNSQMFSTSYDNQTEFVVRIAEGEREMFADNTFVGEIRLSGIPPATKGVPQIKVTLNIDANGILNVSAEDLAMRRKIESRMESPYCMNPAQIKVLQRKVGHELQLLHHREREALQQRRYAEDRSRAMTYIKEIDDFLTTYGTELEEKQLSLLVSGKELIYDYLDRNVTRADLKSLIDSVKYSHDDAIISIIERTVASLLTSPLLSHWIADLSANTRTPKLLKDAQNEFRKYFNEEIDYIVNCFQQRNAELQKRLSQRLLINSKDESIETLCVAIILRQFVNCDIDIQYLINIADVRCRPLLSYFLLYELSQRDSVIAAQEIYNLYRGLNCFFLCEYIDKRSNHKNVWLEKSLKEIPAGAWFKHYLDSIPAEREWFKGNPIALKELYRDLIWSLGKLEVETQLIALETIKDLGVEGCLSDLFPMLTVKMDDRVKVKLIILVASSKNEQVILPLIKTLENESLEVRDTALMVLEEYRSMMSPDINRFFDLAQRILVRGMPLHFHERFFLRKFAGEHKNLRTVVKQLKVKKK